MKKSQSTWLPLNVTAKFAATLPAWQRPFLPVGNINYPVRETALYNIEEGTIYVFGGASHERKNLR
jgi:hypothetical protein